MYIHDTHTCTQLKEVIKKNVFKKERREGEILGLDLSSVVDKQWDLG